MDGKTVRGTRASGGAAAHLLACLDHCAGVVLAQTAVRLFCRNLAVSLSWKR